MEAISYTHLRRNLASEMDRVTEDHVPVIVTRRASPAVVLISLEDYEALQETTYLLRSPANVRRLMDSLAELESGGGVERALSE